jgi:hypothetical protein
MNNINDFKNDFYNLMKIEDILEKYKISRATYFNLIKKIGLKRDRTSKLLRTFNINLSQRDNNRQLEQNKSNLSIKDIDETDEKLLYEKQYVPRNTIINVEKQKPATPTKPKSVAKKEQVFKEVDENELNAILDKADKTIAKIQNKKQSKITENKNK